MQTLPPITSPIIIASDHAGFALKQFLVKQLTGEGCKINDLGCHSQESVDYPDFAKSVTESLTANQDQIGILICGSGIGMSIAANRMASVRAALCEDEEAAELARQHNDANILVLGARRLNDDKAYAIVKKFLTTDFSGDARHTRRIGKMSTLPTLPTHT